MKKKSGDECIKSITFAGNPNVGKSTLFNALTGMKQHTGNWAGKTVNLAEGVFKYNGLNYKVVDLPGTYSLMANSKEERCARDYICFGDSELTVIVADATNMERNLNLVLQTLEITDNAILCINLMDEARKKGVLINIDKLSEILNVPVIPVCAKNKSGINKLKAEIEKNKKTKSFKIKYSHPIEKAIDIISETLKQKIGNININTRWIAIRLLCNDYTLLKSLDTYLEIVISYDEELKASVCTAAAYLSENGINSEKVKDMIASQFVMTAEGIFFDTVKIKKEKNTNIGEKTDRIITSKWFAYPVMMVFLCIIFWITVTGANYPSELLGDFFVFLERKLTEFAINLNLPPFVYGMFIQGVFRITGWIVSVMLPPMLIFFPLFTLLEDSGFLPRIAFNLDGIFKKCGSCGKQSLTMCMGFGCNSVGVTGCRIIDSERERLISVLTNSLVPCNGRFPAIIALISMFFITGLNEKFSSLYTAVFLTLTILLGIVMTLLISDILSKTLLKGNSSSYTLELPPYRKPQIISVIVRSVFDRTLFVLGRAVIVAAPAGLIIWLMANTFINGNSILYIISSFLDPIGRFLGLDGVILIAFIAGFPANEIVIPVMLMTYLSNNVLIDYENINFIKKILVDNGWTMLTAVNTVIFTLFHFPCSTTVLTVKKETGSLKWTVISFFLPLLCGIILCLTTKLIFKLL